MKRCPRLVQQVESEDGWLISVQPFVERVRPVNDGLHEVGTFVEEQFKVTEQSPGRQYRASTEMLFRCFAQLWLPLSVSLCKMAHFSFGSVPRG